MTDINSQWSALQQDQLRERGDIAGSRARLEYLNLASRQKAAYAGSGDSTRSGSAAQVQNATRALGDIERLQIQQNAYAQALGLKVENQAAVGQNRMRQLAVRNGINQSYGQMGSQIAGAASRSAYYYGRYQGLGQDPATSNFNSLISGPDLMTPLTPYDDALARRQTENV